MLYKKFEYEALDWLKSLELYNEAPFIKKKSDTDWSMGQLYNHLISFALKHQIVNARHCIEQKNGALTGGKNFKGFMVYFTNGIPFKLKPAYNNENPPTQPENKLEIKDKLIKLLKEMEDLDRDIAGLSKDALKYKTKHPLFGCLNAKEWYQLVIIHFRHHLKQKEKIENTLIV